MMHYYYFTHNVTSFYSSLYFHSCNSPVSPSSPVTNSKVAARSPVHDAGILESHWSRKCGFLHNTQEPRKEKAFHGTSSYLVFPSEHTRWLSHLQNQIWLMTSWLGCASRTLITLCVGNRRERTTPPSPPTTPTPPIEANFNQTRIKNTTIFMKK